MPKEMHIGAIRISCRNPRVRSSTEISCAAIIIIIVTALKENPEKSVARAG